MRAGPGRAGTGLRAKDLGSRPLPFPTGAGNTKQEQIREMNPNYTEFKFPQIKAHPWTRWGRIREFRQRGWGPTGGQQCGDLAIVMAQ